MNTLKIITDKKLPQAITLDLNVLQNGVDCLAHRETAGAETKVEEELNK